MPKHNILAFFIYFILQTNIRRVLSLTTKRNPHTLTLANMHTIESKPTIIEPIPLDLRHTAFAKLLKSLPLPEDVKSNFLQNHKTVEDRDDALSSVSEAINDFFAGQMNNNDSDAAYTLDSLNVYDQLVWEFNAPFLWRITPSDIKELYDECMSANRHCEIAVGTGLFLSQTQNIINNLQSHVTLIDLNPNTLEVCEKRLLLAAATGKHNNNEQEEEDFQKQQENARLLEINKVVGDVLKPIVLPSSNSIENDNNNSNKKFDSIAANFLLHCLHGGDETTLKALSNIAELLDNDNGVFFGSTILGYELHNHEESHHHVPSAALDTNLLYNKIGIFGNMQDSMDGLSQTLQEVFEEVEISRVGFCAVWKARRPKRT